MKRVIAALAVLAAVAVFMVLATGSGSGSSSPTYKVELDNAFGLIPGADFKVSGVRAGKISAIDLDPGCVKGNPADCRALVTVSVTQAGFGSFHQDAVCQSRPQSLIGEYYLECQPGSQGPVLKSGSVIPVTHTQSTIPVDLLNDVMRLPYRQRLTIIINELGAAVAGRSGDLQAALRRAVPALTETDNLLNVLANDSSTINQLNVNANAVITALANNSKDVQQFIVQADRAAMASAAQQTNIAATLHNLPGFLEQLRPAMAQLGAASQANLPVVQNLNTASHQLARLFTDLPGFSRASLPAIRALGQASVTGRQAAQAATPTVRDLNRFAKPTPELAQNLAIVLGDLDNRSRAVEADSRSPGGKGYTGLEAVLQYVFNQTLAVNTFGPLGHLLAVDGFLDPLCTPYASAQTVANNLATYGAAYRRCYAWLGPNQPGINETDPTNPTACVPDPGGAPPGQRGPHTTACKLAANPALSAPDVSGAKTAAATSTSSQTSNAPATNAPSSGAGSGSGQSSGASSGLGSGLAGIIGGVVSTLGGHSATTPPPSAASSTPSPGGQAQQLLNYLLAP
jgi:phospholipid/cholesterol/gamma-HCH transport system substrate-binding protein